jgi:hypothetical protein
MRSTPLLLLCLRNNRLDPAESESEAEAEAEAESEREPEPELEIETPRGELRVDLLRLVCMGFFVCLVGVVAVLLLRLLLCLW